MKHAELLASMTLEDKIALCSGRNFWQTKAMPQYGIPELFMSDGPHGLRKQENASDQLGINNSLESTCFPTAALTASSWDPQLLEAMGAAIAEEAAALGVGLVLGPGANLKRDPRCGRNFEYFSEDPFLAGKLAAGEIRGLQTYGGGASLKHFACNSQEYKRFSSDSVIDDRTLRELYLTAFEIAVKEAQPATVMCAYNKLGGVYCSDHAQLLTRILREEWGFEGLVVTDWGALHDRTEAFRAGCDLAMPGGSAYLEREAAEAVRSGRLSEEAVDRCADRVLTLVERQIPQISCDWDAHHRLARKIAGESAVLLQNRDDLLPLKAEQSAVLLGHMADTPRYQGSGSSHINPTRLISARQAMADLPWVPGCLADGSTTEDLLREAADAAQKAHTAVVFAGLTDLYESEGYDRQHLQMPEGHNRLIETVAAANPNTVVVLTCGSVVECPWADKVKSIVYLGLPGQAVGEAAADVLYGRVNPGGKLAETWPIRLEDCPTHGVFGSRDGQYREGVYVGYRYYDKANRAVRWPFGHGLSYTTFAYENLQIHGRTATVRVTNTGKLPGAEVVQLYITPPVGGLHRPIRELKGFCKVYLQPGETKPVQFELDDRSFALWQDGWVIPGGIYTVQVGGSSRALPLSAEIAMEGPVIPAPQWQAGSWYGAPDGAPSQAQWEVMLGRPYTEPAIQKGQFTMDHTVLDMEGQSILMRLVKKAVAWYIGRGFHGEKSMDNPAYRMMICSSCDCSMSNLQNNSMFRGHLFHALVELANGHLWQGVKLLLKR